MRIRAKYDIVVMRYKGYFSAIYCVKRAESLFVNFFQVTNSQALLNECELKFKNGKCDVAHFCTSRKQVALSEALRFWRFRKLDNAVESDENHFHRSVKWKLRDFPSETLSVDSEKLPFVRFSDSQTFWLCRKKFEIFFDVPIFSLFIFINGKIYYAKRLWKNFYIL